MHGTIIDVIKKRKLRRFGHIVRVDTNKLLKHTVLSRIDDKSRRGRHSRLMRIQLSRLGSPCAEQAPMGCQDQEVTVTDASAILA